MTLLVSVTYKNKTISVYIAIASLSVEMELSRKQECSKFWKLEFHYSKLCLSHHDWKAFTYSPVSTKLEVQQSKPLTASWLRHFR